MIRSKILYFWQPCPFCLQLTWILSDAVVISSSFPCLLCFLAGPCDGSLRHRAWWQDSARCSPAVDMVELSYSRALTDTQHWCQGPYSDSALCVSCVQGLLCACFTILSSSARHSLRDAQRAQMKPFYTDTVRLGWGLYPVCCCTLYLCMMGIGFNIKLNNLDKSQNWDFLWKCTVFLSVLKAQHGEKSRCVLQTPGIYVPYGHWWA